MKEQKGWELDFLEDCIQLQGVLEENPEKLLEYCRQNPLCTVHPNRRKLAIIRKYNFCLDGNSVQLYSGQPYGNSGHWGIELIDLDKEAVRAISEPVPDSLNYQRVEFQGDSILIVAEEKEFLTNWNELERKFPFLTDFSEKEIVEIYDSLKNDVVTEDKLVWKNPITDKIETDFVGTLELNKSTSNFTGEGKWMGKKVTLYFSVDANGEVKRGVQTAKTLWATQTEWNEKIKTFAVKKLLPLKNENWLDEDEKELTAIQFKDRISIESIWFYEEGSFDYFFDDGDLFWGHSIQVSGSLDNGLTDALFQG